MLAARRLATMGFKVGGIAAPRILIAGQTIGYQVTDLATGEVHAFAGLAPPGERIGRYFIAPPNLAFATEALETARTTCHAVLIDEIGRLELAGQGLALGARALLASEVQPILLVRDVFVQDVVRHFGLTTWEPYPITGSG